MLSRCQKGTGEKKGVMVSLIEELHSLNEFFSHSLSLSVPLRNILRVVSNGDPLFQEIRPPLSY